MPVLYYTCMCTDKRVVNKVLHALHAAGVSRRHVKNVIILKNFKILEFGDDIQNHHEKCIEISTNMPVIGSLIREIHIRISEI